MLVWDLLGKYLVLNIQLGIRCPQLDQILGGYSSIELTVIAAACASQNEGPQDHGRFKSLLQRSDVLGKIQAANMCAYIHIEVVR